MTVDLITDAPAYVAEWGESCTYVPRSGASRTIRAVIDREPPMTVAGTDGLAPYAVVYVLNRSTSVTFNGLTFAGIAASEVDTGGDKISYSDRLGGSTVARPVKKIAAQDAGILQLEIR